MASTDMTGIINEHSAALLANATRLTGGDRHLAEDIVQETWLRAWKHADRLSEDFGSIRAWLRRIAHNVAIDQHRSRRARPTEVNLSEPVLHSTAAVGDLADSVNTRIDIDSALETLSPAHRSTVIELYFADHTMTAAAKSLGVPLGTVKSRVHNALNNLRVTLNAPKAA